MEILNVDGNIIRSFVPLEMLENLETLILNNDILNNLVLLYPLKNLINLKNLSIFSISNDQISEVKALLNSEDLIVSFY